MLPLNKESKLQMKLNLPFYISHQQSYLLYRSDSGEIQNRIWKLAILAKYLLEVNY